MELILRGSLKDSVCDSLRLVLLRVEAVDAGEQVECESLVLGVIDDKVVGIWTYVYMANRTTHIIQIDR